MINMSKWPDHEAEAREYLARKKRYPLFEKLANDYLKKKKLDKK